MMRRFLPPTRPMRLAACGIFAALAVASPSAALAAANHPFLSAGPPIYEDACGLALKGSGLYVSDYYHDQIELPSGQKILNEDPRSGPCKLGLDSGGDLFVYNWHHDVVEFAPSAIPGGPSSVIDPQEPSEAEKPTGLAVDPETGTLYVSHRTYVAKYEAPVHAGETPSIVGLDSGAAYYGVAVSDYAETKGYLYVPDAATQTIKVLSSAGALVETMNGEATPQGRFLDLVDSEAVVDNNPTSPSYGHLYVLDRISKTEHPEGALDEFNAVGAYRGQIKGFVDAGPSGVAIEATAGNVYVTSGNTEGSAVFKYGPTARARLLKVTRTGTGGGAVTSNPVGVKCGGACAAEFNEGEKVTLSAAPDGHSVFEGWSVIGAEACLGTGTCTVPMSHAVEVSAKFEEAATQETLTVSETGTGQGAVTSEPAGISCPPTCTERFAEGRLVTLTARPAPHSRFAEWLGPDCDESTQPTCQITMSAAKGIGAKFEPIPPQTLTVALSGSGSGEVMSFPAGISCPGTCSAGFDEGASVTLIALPDPGSEFGGWSGACSGTATTCTVAMEEARAVGAEFSAPLPPSAAAQAGALATASLPAGSTTTALRGRSASPAAGSRHKQGHRRPRRHHRKGRRRG